MMDSARSPPSPTFFPTARLSNPSRTSQSQASTFSTSRSPPSSRPLSSSTHLLQDLEPRTYDSQSDAGSTFSGYKDSPPTAGAAEFHIQTDSQSRPVIPAVRNRSRSRKWPKARRFEGRSTYNDVAEHHGLRRNEQSRSYADEPEEFEQHPLDPTPQLISRRRSKAEEELPRWARSTGAGRLGLEREDTVKLETVQPGWLKAQQRQETVKFSIPPPITESLMLPSRGAGGSGDGKRYRGSEESILSSIFGAFPGVGSAERGSGEIMGRNKVSKLGEEWASIIRHERVLQSQIQSLLDQQSARLQAAQTGGDSISRGSSMRSGAMRSSTTLNGRRDRMETPRGTLHTARMELLRGMYTLMDLAAAKEAVLAETLQSLEAAQTQLSNWQLNLNVAEEKIRELGPGDENNPGTDDRIWKELQELEPLIAVLERKLKIAKDRKKRLQQQQKESRSVREADAARWVEAKREIDKDVGRWMKDPSLPSDMLEQDYYWGDFMKLPAGRRNLNVAIENLGSATRGIRKRLAGAQTERDACERGAQLWSESLEMVMKAEKTMKTWMERSLQGKGDPMEEMITCMEETEGGLQDKLDVAEKEGWNLIVCALGAELEAWREGLEIMRQMTKGKSQERTTRRGKEVRGLKLDNRSTSKEKWKEMSSMGGSTEEHSNDEADPARRRGHSVNTQSTEDPMWGSGVDKDAELLAELEGGLEELQQLSQQAQPIERSKKGRNIRDRDGGMEEGSNSGIISPPEEFHAIITEGLNVSPAPSPWKDSKSNSSVKATLKVEEHSQPGTPDREVSFRTAMEHSIVGGKMKDGETAKHLERSESPEALTTREQRRPPHMRKGVVKMDGGLGESDDGGREESDDGEVPVDLLG